MKAFNCSIMLLVCMAIILVVPEATAIDKDLDDLIDIPSFSNGPGSRSQVPTLLGLACLGALVIVIVLLLRRTPGGVFWPAYFVLSLAMTWLFALYLPFLILGIPLFAVIRMRRAPVDYLVERTTYVVPYVQPQERVIERHVEHRVVILAQQRPEIHYPDPLMHDTAEDTDQYPAHREGHLYWDGDE